MSQEDELSIPCSEQGCSEHVSYSGTTLLSGLAYKKAARLESPRERTVGMYLRCGRGHIHRYEVVVTA